MRRRGVDVLVAARRAVRARVVFMIWKELSWARSKSGYV